MAGQLGTTPYGNHSIKNANGYESIGDQTNREHFATKMKERTYCDSIIAQISMNEFEAVDGIAQCGDTMTWLVPANPSIRRLNNNEKLKHSTVSVCQFSLKIGAKLYSSYKMSEYDWNRACDSQMVMSRLLDDTQSEMRRTIDKEALALMIASAHCANQGTNAGVRTKCVNLGTCEAPLCIDETNAHLFPGLLSKVVGEWCTPGGDWFAIIPSKLSYVMKISTTYNDLLSNCGQCAFPLITGQMPGMIEGFSWIESDLLDCMPCMSGNDVVYPVIFGKRKATSFVSLFDLDRVMSDVNDFGRYWQIMMAYGLGVSNPEYLGVAYVRVNTPQLTCA